MSYEPGLFNRGNIQRLVKNQQKKLIKQQRKIQLIDKASERNKNDIIEEQLNDYIVQLININPDDYPIFRAFIEVVTNNLNKDDRGKRYKSLSNFFALSSYFGKSTCNILHNTLYFPSYKTMKKYKQEIHNEWGLDEHLFNGSLINLQKLIRINSNYQFTEAVIMVDAASVTPYVSIDNKGNVTGLLNIDTIDIDLTEHLLDDKENFCQFLLDNKKFIIESEFVFMISPIDGSSDPFPIYVKSSHSGNATTDITDDIKKLIENLKEIDINIIGVCTDGDPQYLKYSRICCNNIFNNFEEFYTSDITEFMYRYNTFFHFSDPFHLIKRDRYKKIRGTLFYCSPYPFEEQFIIKDLTQIGISKYLLDDDRSRKMEDSLALKLFSAKNVYKIYESDNIYLLISFLPSALLVECFLNAELNREERISKLLFGAAIVTTYYIIQKRVLMNDDFIDKEDRKEYKKLNCFTTEWCEEYLSLTFSTVYLLLNKNKLNLGALGSHHVEHLFGNIRRLCKHNNTHKNFMYCLKDYVTEKHLLDLCEISNLNQRNIHDSGALIDDNLSFISLTFLPYLLKAIRLINNFKSIQTIDFFDNITLDKSIMEKEELIEFLPRFSDKKVKSISTKSEEITVTGGLSKKVIYKACQQINNIED